MSIQKTPLKNETKSLTREIQNFPFLVNNLERAAKETTTDFNEFLEISQEHFSKVSELINDFLKRMNQVYGKNLMGEINSKSNKIFLELVNLKKEIAKPKSNLFVISKPNGLRVYNIRIFTEFVNKKIDEIIIPANELIERHRSRTNRLLYTNNLDDYHEAITNEESETKFYFKNLEENTAFDPLIPEQLNKETKLISIKRENVFNKFFEVWKGKNNHKKFFDKTDKILYDYSLIDFYKKYDKLKIKQERLFWKCEVAKVKILNKPHKSESNNTHVFSDYIIDLEDVIKYYSNGVTTNKVLRGLNLKIPEGEFVVILGPSGSGKTTLLNIISGMDRASSGKTIIANTNLIGLSDTKLTEFRKNNIGYIFQQYGLLPNLTVKENIEIGAHLQKDPAKRLNINDLLKDIGMYDHRNKLPAELSGGQQQRVSVARAIAKNPKIIFGDEPTGALDEEMTQIVLQQFLDINKKYKTTLILVTHNPLIAEIATFVIKVGDGVIKSAIRNPNPKNIKDVKWSS